MLINVYDFDSHGEGTFSDTAWLSLYMYMVRHYATSQAGVPVVVDLVVLRLYGRLMLLDTPEHVGNHRHFFQ